MNNLPPIFAEMQEKLDKPTCIGNYGKPAKDLICGMCWFWPVCKEEKKQPELNIGTEEKPKRGRPSAKKESDKESE